MTCVIHDHGTLLKKKEKGEKNMVLNMRATSNKGYVYLNEWSGSYIISCHIKGAYDSNYSKDEEINDKNEAVKIFKELLDEVV